MKLYKNRQIRDVTLYLVAIVTTAVANLEIFGAGTASSYSEQIADLEAAGKLAKQYPHPSTQNYVIIGAMLYQDEDFGSFITVGGFLLFALDEGGLRYFPWSDPPTSEQPLLEPLGGRSNPSPASSVPDGATSAGLNISRDGNTIVGYIDNGFFTPFHACKWTEADGIVDLGTLDPEDVDAQSFATDVNNEGSVIVGYSGIASGIGDHAFLWTESSGMVDLGSANGETGNSRAFGVSGDGSVVIGQTEYAPDAEHSFVTRQAFRWTQDDGFQQLGTLDGTPRSFASHITADGSIIVGRASVNLPSGNTTVSRQRAMRWTEATGMQNLGVLDGFEYSAAVSASDDGTVVIGICSDTLFDNLAAGGTLRYSASPESSRAFYWTVEGGMQDLTQLLVDAGVDMSSGSLVGVTGMTPDGSWISAVTTKPDPEFPESITLTIPVLVSLTETLPPWSRLLNLSTRAQTLTGDNVLIPGFVVQGAENKRLLIRVVGPTLAGFGVQDALIDPVMTLKKTVEGSSVDVAANDDWGTNSNAAEIVTTTAAVGGFALEPGSKDSALLLEVEPGQYTVVAEGVGDTTGVTIVEVYDVDPGTDAPRLINISTRGFVGEGDSIMIPGFVVSDDSSGRLLVRAVGPTLGGFGVPDVLGDPQLTIFRQEADGSSTEIFSNDDWGSASSAPNVVWATEDAGAFPLDSGSKDAALVVQLLPGAYTVQASGVNDSTGTALVEVYELP